MSFMNNGNTDKPVFKSVFKTRNLALPCKALPPKKKPIIFLSQHPNIITDCKALCEIL